MTTTRRRGTELTRAIYLATLNELADTSFEELAFDKIAARAGTGKAALYRRWATTAELVLAALTDPASGFPALRQPRTGSLRSDLLALLTDFARTLDEPHGRALRPLMTQRTRHPELYARVRELIVEPRHGLLMRILATAVAAGEARTFSPRIAAAGLRLVVAVHMDIAPVPAAEVEAIVDEILLPLVQAP